MGCPPPPLARIPQFGITTTTDEDVRNLRAVMPKRPPFEKFMLPWFSINDHAMTDKEFLRFGKERPLVYGCGWKTYGKYWQAEFARRFYLRPLEARPNTQGGDVLVRAV